MLPPMMSVNGPADGEMMEVDVAISHDPLTPLLPRSPPDDDEDLIPTPAPVSPGKKRVRISDSTSVRVIEDPPPLIDYHHHHHHHHRRQHQPAVIQHKSFYHQFNSAYHDKHDSATNPKARRELKFSSNENFSVDKKREGLEDFSYYYFGKECEVEEYRKEYHDGDGESAVLDQEFQECLTRVEQLTFPEDVPSTVIPSLHDNNSTTTTGSPLLSLAPFREPNNRIFLVTDPPQELNPVPLEGKNGTSLYVIDRVTGWPLKRSPSLESRDNPFLPGGDLSKEAEDLLSKATIVRDKFYLEQQNQGHAPPSDHHPAPPHSTQPSHHDSVDGTLPNDKTHPGAVEERIAPTSASRAEARPEPPHPRENGKASDGVTSPDGVKVEVGATPTADGGKGGGSDNAGDQQQEKDKAKRRPKCCVVM